MFKKFSSGAPDFLAIGDITTDAFIRLKDASVHCRMNREQCELCLRFADKVPFEFVEIVRAVGNAANAAVSASRLGLSSALMSNIGADQNGQECIDELKKNRVSTTFISRHRNQKTNYHYVLWFEDERTILIKHEDFDYKFQPPRHTPKWVYLSSLGANSLDYQLQIADWLKIHHGPSASAQHGGHASQINFAFQPGTFQLNAGAEKLEAFYRLARVFFCNVEEAKRILKWENSNRGDNFPDNEIKKLLMDIHALGPKIVVITDGPRGAYAFDSEAAGDAVGGTVGGGIGGATISGVAGGEFWFMPPYPDPKPPYERTGAGDAFASTFTAALALGKNVSEALRWAPINSMSVVQYIGAQKGLLNRRQIEEFLAKAPADYRPRRI